MEKRFLDYIRENSLIGQDETVCAGVSGGADSVCLLILLKKACEELGFSLRAFHVNHNLRGEESRADRDFTVNICEELGVPLKVFSYDVKALSAEWKKGTEETGRICRRQAAEEMLMSGCDKIALAHHLNDQAETLLFNLARGASLKGLSGISPVSGKIIHPLLCFTKPEIEDYLSREGYSWRVDSTNADSEYARNRIRNEILPALEGINSGARDHIVSAAADISEADVILTGLAREKQKDYIIASDEGFCVKGAIMNEPPLLRGYIFKEALKNYRGSVTDLSRIHIEKALSLFEGISGRSVSLPFGMTARREYDLIKVSDANDGDDDRAEISEKIVPNTVICLGEIEINIGGVEENEGKREFPDLMYTKTFDYDKIKDACLRKPLRGDFIVTCADGGKKKLSGYFKDIKLRGSARNSRIVLADGSEVFWVIGQRMSESAKVTDKTARIITMGVKER